MHAVNYKEEKIRGSTNYVEEKIILHRAITEKIINIHSIDVKTYKLLYFVYIITKNYITILI